MLFLVFISGQLIGKDQRQGLFRGYHCLLLYSGFSSSLSIRDSWLAPYGK